jgi:hypothetical protein
VEITDSIAINYSVKVNDEGAGTVEVRACFLLWCEISLCPPFVPLAHVRL